MTGGDDVILSVIIVNYNVKYFLEQTLLSVRKAASQLPVEVFVVDNNSADGSVAMVQEKFPEVQLIANTDNPGFSIANNQAIRISNGKYVLLLNPDTVVEEKTFRVCLDFMESHPEAGGLGVKMIDGAGNFLPESKRGFPSPFVAFCKAFGLSRVFPKSPLFNRYHLGYLDKDENHEVDVLSGAFMLMRRSVLDQVGLLDESFFMYGEDIDLSYRIVQGGYKNYYLADTTIIHYKGESTKKGSLNYVKTFYQAMIIFARKHFSGNNARLFIWMIQLAIYFRAFLTLLRNWSRRAVLPLLDASLITLGLYFLKDFWATYYHKDPDYYQSTFLYFNVPLYLLIWLGTVYFSGGYDRPYSIRRLVRGLLVGTVVLAAIYGFLPLDYRPSRALIILGAVWSVIATVSLRMLTHLIRFGHLPSGQEKERNLIIVGSQEESERVQQLLHRVHVKKNIIGTVAPDATADMQTFLNGLDRLGDVVNLYRIEEIIFCGRDVSSQAIMHWMTELGPQIDYRIVPSESLSIIGSQSKNSAGELYTVDIQFNIASSMSRRNKRVVDLLVTLVLLLGSPLLILGVDRKFGFLQNLFKVLIGRLTWVGYAGSGTAFEDLPELKRGVLTPESGRGVVVKDEPTRKRLNFFYAKDYRPATDVEIVLRAIRSLGDEKEN
jgi:GT2 family glycosyltransferase